MLVFTFSEEEQLTTAFTDGFAFGWYDHVTKESNFANMDGEWHPCQSIDEFKRLIMEQSQDNDVWTKDTSPNDEDCNYLDSDNIPSHRGVQESYEYTMERNPTVASSSEQEFVPNSMNFHEFQDKVLCHLNPYIIWLSKENPDASRAEHTFADWIEDFSAWMQNGAPD